MPTYTLRGQSSGRTYDLDAPDLATAGQAVLTLERQAIAETGHASFGAPATTGTHSTGEDAARGTLGGLIQGAAGFGGLINAGLDAANRTIAPVIGRRVLAPVARITARAAGATPTQAEGLGRDVEAATPAVRRAVGRVQNPVVHHNMGGDYTTQTGLGHFAQTVGQNAVGAMIPGGLITKAAGVIAPAVGSEVAGYAAEHSGASPTGVGIARTAGGLIGGGLVGGGATMAGLIRNAAGHGAVDMATGMAQANAELARLNIHPADLPTGANARIQQLIQQGADPVAAVNHTMAESLPSPVPISRGQASGSAEEQAVENSAGRGANGAGPAALVQGQKTAATTALRTNADTIAADLAGGAAPAPTDAGVAVSDRLNEMHDSARTQVNAAYSAARDAGGEQATIPRAEVPAVANALHTAVAHFDPVRVPSVYSEIGRLNGVADLTAEGLFRSRSVFTNLAASSDAVEANAARAARRAVDGVIDDAVARDLFAGSPDAVARWRAAIGQRRAFGQLFEGDDLVQRLTEREPSGGGNMRLAVAPEDAANYVLGRSSLGFVGRRNLLRDMTRVRDTLGPASDQWNGLRSAIFQRFVQTGEGAAGTGTFSGQRFANAWRDATARDPRMMGMIFTPAERATITRLAAVAQRVTTPVPGGFNPSNTATVAAVLQRAHSLGLADHIPGLRPVLNFISEAAAASRVRRMVVNPTPSAGAPRLPVVVPAVRPAPIFTGLIGGSTSERAGLLPAQ